MRNIHQSASDCCTITNYSYKLTKLLIINNIKTYSLSKIKGKDACKRFSFNQLLPARKSASKPTSPPIKWQALHVF
jgi:hypothetical protein